MTGPKLAYSRDEAAAATGLSVDVISRRPARNSGYCRSWLGIPRQTA